jgi:hypothetical protein
VMSSSVVLSRPMVIVVQSISRIPPGICSTGFDGSVDGSVDGSIDGSIDAEVDASSDPTDPRD